MNTKPLDKRWSKAQCARTAARLCRLADRRERFAKRGMTERVEQTKATIKRIEETLRSVGSYDDVYQAALACRRREAKRKAKKLGLRVL